MDIWFIDAENVGCALLEQLPVGASQHCRFMVFSRSSNARKWTARYPLHARLFDDYEVGKNQADFYMVSVLTQVLTGEPDTRKRIMLLTKDQELIQAFKVLCQRFQVEIILLVSPESAQLPDPKVAHNSGIKAQNLGPATLESPVVKSPPVNTPPAQAKAVVTQTPVAEKPASAAVTPVPAAKTATAKQKKISGEALKKARKKVRKALKNQPLTIHEMMALLGVSFSDIQEITNPLIKERIIVRVNKTGKKWQLGKQSA